MTKQTRLTAAEWQRHIAAQLASGQTQRDYCLHHGLSLYSFRDYKYPRRKVELLKEERLEERPNWLELPPGLTTTSSDWLIELDLGNGVCLRLRQG
jgi:putative transposase